MATRMEQRAATRRALAEAALRLFLEKGVDATTVEEIAAAAGVSTRTFFLHYSSKAAAVFPDHDEHIERFRAELARLPAGGDDIDAVCRLVIRGVRDQLVSEFRRGRYALLATEPGIRDVDSRGDRDYERAIADHLMARWAADEQAVFGAHAVANVVIGIVRAALLVWGRGARDESSGGAVEGRFDPVEATQRLLDRLVSSPLGPGALTAS